MKTIKLPVLFLLIAFCLSTQAQVAINKDGSAPAATSILHVKGDDSGTPVEAMFIESETGNVSIGTTTPDTDLHIYSNADNNGLTLQTSDNTFKQGIRFRNSGGSYTWNVYRKDAGSSHADLVFANGLSSNITALTDVVTFKDGGSVGIGTANPDASAVLDISSTSRSFLPPRMTASQMQAIASPATGLCVFNTDVNAQCTYNGSSWDCLDGQSLHDIFFECGNSYVDLASGNEFSTVLIGDQCWMLENLNVGSRINVNTDQSDNGTLEKYCYDDDEANCDVYGGLYQWDEMMQYVTSQRAQGICPDGWHLPSHNEVCILENEVDAGTIPCDGVGLLGIDAGGNLKETGTTHWNSPNIGATNSSGFTALAGGQSNNWGEFNNFGIYAYFWTSTFSILNEYSKSFGLGRNHAKVYNYPFKIETSMSVRCLRD